MKKLILAVIAISAIMTGCKSGNPLLVKEFNTPYQTTPFNEIKLEHYMPAFKEGIVQAKAGVEAIVNNPERATFENTIEALERNGELLGRTATIFFVLNNVESTDQMEEIASEVQPMLTEYGNDVSLNPALFERVKVVYDHYAALPAEENGLNTEQRMLLEDTYKGFTRSGAGLNDADKQEYRNISTELSGLTLKFGQNVLNATNKFSLNIPAEDAAKIEYMPDFVKSALAAEATSRGETGWTVTLAAPSISPFLTYSKERDLKEKVWKASNSRCLGDEYDNSENVKRISELRLKIANLLGYKTYADYVLEERMAESRENVSALVDELLVSTLETAKKEQAILVAYAKQLDGEIDFQPWDQAYYNEKYKNEKYEINQELIKPYFKLENVEKGTFLLAEKLYGITFKPAPDIQVYNPEVSAFEVFDNDGSFLAVLYMDYFPRKSKRSGAWMTSYRDMYTTAEGVEVRPHVTLNFNFTKPIGDQPALLTFDEFETVLHEFGHGLHGMFAKGTYSSLTGTSVFRDFVELPSQILENWGTEKEFLDLFAVHYQTGEKMPEELINKIITSKNYRAAFTNVRQLSLGMGDMAWHSITEPIKGGVTEFENKATASTQLTPPIEGTCMATAFSHIFSGGYAAGYYGYKWAEVLEADAFSIFKKEGVFNREVAQSFRDNILSRGGIEHPMKLYFDFSGHKPETKALIDKIIGQ